MIRALLTALAFLAILACFTFACALVLAYLTFAWSWERACA